MQVQQCAVYSNQGKIAYIYIIHNATMRHIAVYMQAVTGAFHTIMKHAYV